jgi:hypothetical protein
VGETGGEEDLEHQPAVPTSRHPPHRRIHRRAAALILPPPPRSSRTAPPPSSGTRSCRGSIYGEREGARQETRERGRGQGGAAMGRADEWGGRGCGDWGEASGFVPRSRFSPYIKRKATRKSRLAVSVCRVPLESSPICHRLKQRRCR